MHPALLDVFKMKNSYGGSCGYVVGLKLFTSA